MAQARWRESWHDVRDKGSDVTSEVKVEPFVIFEILLPVTSTRSCFPRALRKFVSELFGGLLLLVCQIQSGKLHGAYPQAFRGLLECAL